MAKPLMHIEGANGNVELLPDRVVITRPGLWNVFSFGFNAKREIPLSSIAEVLLKPAGMLIFGEIEFISNAHQFAPANKKANPNAVKFKRASNDAFEAFKEKIFELMHEQHKPQK